MEDLEAAAAVTEDAIAEDGVVTDASFEMTTGVALVLDAAVKAGDWGTGALASFFDSILSTVEPFVLKFYI